MSKRRMSDNLQDGEYAEVALKLYNKGEKALSHYTENPSSKNAIEYLNNAIQSLSASYNFYTEAEELTALSQKTAMAEVAFEIGGAFLKKAKFYEEHEVEFESAIENYLKAIKNFKKSGRLYTQISDDAHMETNKSDMFLKSYKAAEGVVSSNISCSICYDIIGNEVEATQLREKALNNISLIKTRYASYLGSEEGSAARERIAQFKGKVHYLVGHGKVEQNSQATAENGKATPTTLTITNMDVPATDQGRYSSPPKQVVGVS